jgi:hypothetical protein
MASRFPLAAQAAALAPAGVGLALLVVVVEFRMDEPWADGVLFLVAAVAAAALLILGLAAAEGDGASQPAMTALLVGGLLLAGIAIARLGNLLGGDDFTAAGGTLTWVLALFAAVAGFCAQRTGSSACLLIAALAVVAFVLEFVNWVFGAEDVDTFRVLLAIAFVVLFGAGATLPGRTGTVLVVAAGVTVIASYYTVVFAVLFGDTSGLGWGWELITLLQGLALAVYAAARLERGPGYLAFFVLLLFAITASIVGGEDQGGVFFEGEEPVFEEPSVSLIGWPLVLLIGTIAAAAAGMRRQVAAKS